MQNYFDDNNKSIGSITLAFEMIRKMSGNCDKNMLFDFLYEVGLEIARKNQVQARDSLTQFHLQMNSALEKLGFGVLSVEDTDEGLVLTARQMPVIDDPSYADKWLECFSVVVCGILNGWFTQTGAPSALFCNIKEMKAPNSAVYVLKKR